MTFELRTLLIEAGYMFTSCHDDRLAVLFKYNPFGKTCIVYINNFIQPTLFSQESLEPLRRTAKKCVNGIEDDNILFLVEDLPGNGGKYRGKNMIVIGPEGKRIMYENLSGHPEFKRVYEHMKRHAGDKRAEKRYSKATVAHTRDHMPICTVLFMIMNIMMLPLMNSVAYSASREAVFEKGEYFRLMTYMFIHGGLLHLISNMISLWYMGRMYERKHGMTGFLSVYLIGGVFAGCASITLSSGYSYTVGASGAIFALVGAILTEAAVNKNYVRLKGILWLTLWNLAFGLINPRIDNICHLGGFVAGMMIGYVVLVADEIIAQIRYLLALNNMTRRGLAVRYVRRR